MTTAEVRGTVLAYHRIAELMCQPLTEEARERLTGFLRWAEAACQVASDTAGPVRWARRHVGPVLAAGLAATIYMREDVPNANAALRVFGLAGEHPLSSASAWRLMQPYLQDTALEGDAVAEIRRRSGLRLFRLPLQPSPLDVLEELTRPRNSAFGIQMTTWLVTYFRTHPQAETPYAQMYRSTLADLEHHNRAGEMAQLTGATLLHGRLAREDWQLLMHNRLPQARLEARAGYLVAKAFVADYWGQWHPEKVEVQRLAAG